MINPIVRVHAAIARKGMHDFIRENALAIGKGARVLNVGSGGAYGHEIKKVAEKNGFEVISIDISNDRGPDIVGDIVTYDFEGQTFDAIFMLDVIEHIPEAFSVPDKLFQILKPDGSLILSAPFIFPVHDKPHDYYRFTHYGLRYMFSQFDDVVIKPRNSWSEAINVLRARICVEKSLALRLWGHALMLYCLLVLPFVYLLGKVLPSDTMTSGYILTATRKLQP